MALVGESSGAGSPNVLEDTTACKWEEKKQAARQALADAAAGTTGSTLSTLTFYPIELVKNRLQAAATGKAGYAYSSMWDGLSTIARESGARGLYVGLGPILTRSIISDFSTFYLGELLLGWSGQSAMGAAALPLRMLGASASTVISLPIENISTRVTVSQTPLSVYNATAQLWKEGGLASFWRGFQVMQFLCINPALTLCSFDWLRRLFIILRQWLRGRAANHTDEGKEEGLSYFQNFMVGAVAKLFTMCLVYPLIRAKFLLQSRPNPAGTGLLRVLQDVYAAEGFRSLYSGLDAQLSKSLCSTALQFATKGQVLQAWQTLLMPHRAMTR